MAYRRRNREIVSVVKWWAIALVLNASLGGCGQQHTNGTPATGPGNAANKSVTLSASQLGAIKIATVTSYLFHNDKEAIGSVNFSEDPSIVQAESTLLGSAANYDVAEKELDRAKSLYMARGVSERELEQATSDEQTAKAALDAARNALLVVGKTGSEIDRILASGKVGDSLLERKGFKWVLVDATESDTPSLRVGQPVRVVVDAIPGRDFIGRIKEIYSVIDPALHRVSVRAEVGDPSNQLRSGMLADVRIQVAEPIKSLSIPSNGVVREGDGTMTAWVTADRIHFFQKDIEVGRNEDGRVEVLKGVQAGQLVVTDGAVLLDNVLLAPSGD
jgi:membrane fusion protein, heavy metal efflux system